MSQNISFDEYILLISAGIARYNVSVSFQCWGNQYGFLQLIFVDMNGLAYDPVYRGRTAPPKMISCSGLFYFSYLETKSKPEVERLKVSNQMSAEIHKVQLKVGFMRNQTYTSTDASIERNYCIVDDIQFFIIKAG